MSIYTPLYEKLYSQLSSESGMSKDEIDIFILKLIKIITKDLNRTGKAILPYFGVFSLKRMPSRKRVVKDFETGETITINIPAEDKLKFKINKTYSKLFK